MPHLQRDAAVKDMPAPDNIDSLQSFLGQANYYQIFISNMDDLRALPNELLRKRTSTGFGQQNSGRHLKNKEKLKLDRFLTYHNTDLDIIAASDASSYGVGVCIIPQKTDGEIKPITHATRALLPAEKNILKVKKSFGYYM